jgi:NAD(P)-dependent dehydrogenase (short-subunit alcohol dehydrogenase family)
MGKITIPPTSTIKRMFKNMWRQSLKTSICPAEPRLDGKLALVTGGNLGIGLETCKGLAQRGADIIILARKKSKAEQAVQEISLSTNVKVEFIQCDLGNLENVILAKDEISEKWPDRKIDLLIANAGIVANCYSQSEQGFELTFAVNVLGHHALIKSLRNHSKLSSTARIVMLTGDIYFLARECTPNFKYTGRKGNVHAYSRSKLGNLWWVKEWAKRYKGIDAYAVHPGGVNSGLGGEVGAIGRWIRKKLGITTELGAQMSLWCATQKNLTSGGYYHNTMGYIQLSENDPGTNAENAGRLWNNLEEITAHYRV